MTTTEFLQVIESAVSGLERGRPERDHSLRVLRRVREIVSQREARPDGNDEDHRNSFQDPFDALLARVVAVQRHNILSHASSHARENVPDWCALKPS